MSSIIPRKNEATKEATKPDPSTKEKNPTPEATSNLPTEPFEKQAQTKSSSISPTNCLGQIASVPEANTPNEEDKEQFNAMWDLVIALEGLGFGNPGQVRERPKFTTMECMADGYALQAEFDKALNSSKATIDAIIASIRSENVSQRGGGGGATTQGGESPKGGSRSTSAGDIKGHATSYWTCVSFSSF